MKLSSELISQFAKITNDKPERQKESYVYGTAYKTDKVDGTLRTYVRIDGNSNVATWLTPVATTTDVNGDEVGNGDRVMVRIKDHKATITGNLSSPSTNSSIIHGLVSDSELQEVTVKVDQLQTDVTNLDTNKLEITEAEDKYATIEQLNSLSIEGSGINLKIESSNGIAFKNHNVSTSLNAIIYKGSKRITDLNTLRTEMGNDLVYLRWKYKKINDDTFWLVSSTDSRLSNDGFTLTIGPDDVNPKTTFICEVLT